MVIKKILGWIIIAVFVLGFLSLEILRTREELYCNLLTAIAITIISILVSVGFASLLILALNWIIS